MEKRLVCKVHDKDEVVIQVGVQGERVYPVLAVWNDITNGHYTFYTFEQNKKAKVYAREQEGTKYLTTYPDGITPNNLDELSSCSV